MGAAHSIKIKETKEEGMDEFKCPICGEAFQTEEALHAHAPEHAPPRFECAVCGAEFKTKDEASAHHRRHGAAA